LRRFSRAAVVSAEPESALALAGLGLLFVGVFADDALTLADAILSLAAAVGAT